MKSPIVTTLLMLAFAAISSLVAANFYPWPEAVTSGDRINTLLFEEFGTDFQMDDVRGIKIVEYDNDRNELKNIQLRRRGDKWILPGKGNFVVTNIRQITDVGSSLTEKKIREEMSDTQEDHLEYGVVDPGNYAKAVRSSLGAKVILEGRQDKELGSLIIGKAVKSDSQIPQRFVRIPGQPHVYVIDFDASILSTDVEDWIDPNLLQLGSQSRAGHQPHAVQIDNYRIAPEKITSGKRERLYRLRYALKGKQLGFDSLEIPADDDKWKPIAPNNEQLSKLNVWARIVGNLSVSDVRRKSKTLIGSLRKAGSKFTPALDKELNSFGFNKIDSEGVYEFDSAGGKFSCITSAGVRLDIYIGNFAENAKTSRGNSARYLMIYASVEDGQFPEPEKSENAEDEDRAYLRAVEERNKKIDAARKYVRDLNKTYADWFYVVDQTILEQLVPNVKLGQASVDQAPSLLVTPEAENN